MTLFFLYSHGPDFQPRIYFPSVHSISVSSLPPAPSSSFKVENPPPFFPFAHIADASTLSSRWRKKSTHNKTIGHHTERIKKGFFMWNIPAKQRFLPSSSNEREGKIRRPFGSKFVGRKRGCTQRRNHTICIHAHKLGK